MVNRSIAYWISKDFVSAAQDGWVATQLQPKYTSAQLRLAQAQLSRGLFIQAREAFHAALQSDHRCQEAVLGLERCDREITAQLLVRLEDMEDGSEGQENNILYAPPEHPSTHSPVKMRTRSRPSNYTENNQQQQPHTPDKKQALSSEQQQQQEGSEMDSPPRPQRAMWPCHGGSAAATPLRPDATLTPAKHIFHTPPRNASMAHGMRLQGGNGSNDEHTDTLATSIGLYTLVLSSEPENILAWLNRGLVHFRLGQYELALSDALSALALEPKCALTHLRIAQASFRLSRNSLALEEFRRALDLTQTLSEEQQERLSEVHWLAGIKRSANNGCIALQKQGYKTTTLQQRTTGSSGEEVKKKQRLAKDCLEKGKTSYHAGDWASAVSAFSASLDLLPDSVVCLCHRAAAAQRTRPARLDLAFRDALRAREVCPFYGFAHVQLGLVYREQGLFSEAVECFLAAVEAEPVRQDAIQQLIQLAEITGDRCILTGQLKKKGETGLKWFKEKTMQLYPHFLTWTSHQSKSRGAISLRSLQSLHEGLDLVLEVKGQHWRREKPFFYVFKAKSAEELMVWKLAMEQNRALAQSAGGGTDGFAPRSREKAATTATQQQASTEQHAFSKAARRQLFARDLPADSKDHKQICKENNNSDNSFVEAVGLESSRHAFQAVDFSQPLAVHSLPAFSSATSSASSSSSSSSPQKNPSGDGSPVNEGSRPSSPFGQPAKGAGGTYERRLEN
eukprot:gb/GEZN01002286.1/.p1 GENE.gb/GEZN01002286.1/~~gb/GEZN01002286.1/.p1  ORF type:complete len:795 (-),score=147.22 gb/GEZN01002286.1/:166-2370(-)